MNGDAARDDRVLVFGEVLYDCFPDGQRTLGGAPLNVAWHLQRFGLPPTLVSRVGADALGDACLEAMARWGLAVDAIERDDAHPTGQVQVTFDGDEARYHIARDAAWDHIAGGAAPTPARLLYHGTLGLRSPVSRRTLERLRDAGAELVFCDVNLRPPDWERAHVLGLLEGATVVKMNTDELAALCGTERGSDALRRELGLEALIVTRGAAGAEVFAADGRHTIAPEPVDAVVDTVGAGDAFTSVVLLGLVRGWSWPVALPRAQRFASEVVQCRGALVKDRDLYARVIRSWEGEG